MREEKAKTPPFSSVLMGHASGIADAASTYMARKLFVITGLFSLLVVQAASAQPRWGRERVPKQGVCLYEDKNFKGRYFCLRPGDRLTMVPDELADEISSIRLRGNAEVTVFRDSEMRGRSARFITDVRDLKREGWNDQISSVDVGNPRDYRSYGGVYDDRGRARGRDRDINPDRGGWMSDRPPVWGQMSMPQEGACFYQDADFHGEYFCVPRGGTYTSLPRGFNDRISSIKVFDGAVMIFKDTNFRGPSTQIASDVRDLRGSWRDKVSSIRVF